MLDAAQESEKGLPWLTVNDKAGKRRDGRNGRNTARNSEST
jgi:hypothetical protein